MIKLTQKVLDDVFQIYVEIFEPHFDESPRLEDVERFFEDMGGNFEYRVGSKWSGHSKFWIHRSFSNDFQNSTYEFRFQANLSEWIKNKELQKINKRIKKAEELFNQQVNAYLEKLKATS